MEETRGLYKHALAAGESEHILPIAEKIESRRCRMEHAVRRTMVDGATRVGS